MNVRQPYVLHSFSIKNIFCDQMDFKLFLFSRDYTRFECKLRL